MKIAVDFDKRGYTVISGVLSEQEVADVSGHLMPLSGRNARTRKLLDQPWCIEIAKRLRSNVHLASLLPTDAVAVQATYFPKSEGQNWKVALHRDLFVPVRRRTNVRGWSGWSVKEGIPFVRPPDQFLSHLVAVRLHLEDNTSANGPLIVVPGSHCGPQTEPRVSCFVPSGGALAMRPLLLHASSKLEVGTRRVLHFLFAPRQLPEQLAWQKAV